MARKHRSQEPRDVVIEAARRTIAALGLQGATVRAIAREAGVSTGHVTHYFESRQQLALAALARNNVVAGTRVLQACASARGVDAIAAAVDALLPADEERRLEWGVWIAFWTASASDAAAARGLEEARRTLATMMATPFAEAAEDGELPLDLDFAYEAERLIVLVSGIGLLINGRDPTDVRRLGRRMLHDHVSQLRGLTAQSS